MTDRSIRTDSERLALECRYWKRRAGDWRLAFWLLFVLVVAVLGLSTARAGEFVTACTEDTPHPAYTASEAENRAKEEKYRRREERRKLICSLIRKAPLSLDSEDGRLKVIEYWQKTKTWEFRIFLFVE